MSTEDKRERQETSADSPATDKDLMADKSIEDAEVIGETPPEEPDVEKTESETGASSVEADPDMTAEEATAAVEEPLLTEPEAETLSETEATSVSEAQDTPAEDEVKPVEEEPVTEEPKTEAPAAPVAAPAPAPASHGGGGVLSTVFGGVLAAIIGFGAAQFIQVDWLDMTGFGKDPVAGSLDAQTAELSELSDRLAALETDMAGTVQGAMSSTAEDLVSRFDAVSSDLGGLQDRLSGELDSISTTFDDAQTQMQSVAEAMTNVDNRLQGFGDSIGSLEERLAQVDERLVAVEQRPLVESSDTARAAFEAYERQLEELRGILAKQRDDAETLEGRLTEMSAASAAQLTAMKEENSQSLEAAQGDAEQRIQAAEQRALDAESQAESRAQAAVAQAALAQIEAALNAGIPYETALPALQAVTDVPAVIAENGAAGIPTVEQLQTRYTPAAREALEASLTETMSEAPGNRIMTFLRTQTGLRSLEAHEGDDPDAVLSRMTVAVENGDLAGALAEFDGLPDAGQSALNSWAEDARDRVAADQALPELAASMNTN